MERQKNIDMIFYPALIHADDSPGYGISFPDFMGCISAGNTLEDVIAMGAEALNFHVESMLEDALSIPSPRSVAEAMGDPDLEDIRQDVRYVVHIPLKMNIAQTA